MSATRAGTAAYQARMYDKTSIFTLMTGGYATISSIVAGVEFASTVGGATAAAGSSAAGVFAIWTMPINAFLLGLSIRQTLEAEAEKRRQAQIIILSAGIAEAVANHGRRFPRSTILDASTPTGIKLLEGPRYFMVTRHFEMLHRKWRKQLADDLERQQGVDDSSWGAKVMVRAGAGETWRQFVQTRFNRIMQEYGNLLVMTEQA